MSGNGIRTVLCVASVKPLEDERLYREAYRRVTEKRKQKADRFRFEKDKRLCVGAELLLRETLKQAGAGEIDLLTEEGAYGKPYLRNYPEIRFNLSHSGETVLCAVSDRETGCDIEEIRKLANLEMMGRFFYRSEFEKIMSAGDEAARAETFYRFWTLKESFMKMKGLGMHLEPQTFGIRLGEAGPYLITGDGEPDACCFREYDSVPGYKCALCIENHPDDIPLETVSLCI